MNFAQAPGDPRQNFVGFSFVLLLHVIVVYGLVSGLAKKVVDVVRAPIETKVIDEIVKKPPPPPENVVPPKLDVPPPAYIPPPEVTIATPPVQSPIAVTTATPPPAPVVVAPVVEAPPVVRPAPVSIRVACPKQVEPVVPSQFAGTSGAVRARLTIRGGRVASVDILSSKPRGIFDEAVRSAVLKYSCQDTGDREVVAEQSFVFSADN